MDPIAEATWQFASAQAPTQEIRVTIGRPVQQADGSWACALSASGAFPRPILLTGRDSFQALAQAVMAARGLVTDMSQRVRLKESASGDSVDFDRYFAPPAESR